MSFFGNRDVKKTTSVIQITYIYHTETMQKPHKDVEIVNVRLPKEIVSILDSLIKKKIFLSRSEAIREFSREYVLDNRIENSEHRQSRYNRVQNRT